MSARWSVAGAAVGCVLGLLFFAPAAWLASVLSAASGDHLRLLQTRGTVWHGDAQLVVFGGAGSAQALALPDRVQWDISPGWNGLHLKVQAACCTPQALRLRLEPSWRGLKLVVADASSQWPAAMLSGLGAPWNTLRPQGVLSLRTQRLSVEWSAGQIGLQGEAFLDALGMSTNLSTLRPVGSYRLSLAGVTKEGLPSVHLQTLTGSLKLSGNGHWSGSKWLFLGEASATPETESVLGNLLNMVGRRQGAKSVISVG